MPELPEVETVKRGLKPYLEGIGIEGAIVRYPQLRWPIPANLNALVQHQIIQKVSRRGKYLIFVLTKGTLLIHLGMSGRLNLLDSDRVLLTHDHVDILLSSGSRLRYNDPRRFGAILWTEDIFCQHPLLQSLGIEPLEERFTGQYLKKAISRHRAPIKSLLMNSKIIAGIGNIYAAEALFLASIHPRKPANQLSREDCEKLVAAIKTVLQRAIEAGGTSLKDFVNSEGKPGYFSQELYVYGRAGAACKRCHTLLQACLLGQRNTVFCPHCQHDPLFN